MSILGGGSAYLFSYSSTDDCILLEKFVGRNFKEFKLVEDELRKIIKIIKNNSNEYKTSLDISEINNSDHNRAIERALKQFFNVKEVKITWTEATVPNAFTVCKTYMVFDSNYKTDEKTNRKSNENLFVGVILHTGIVTIANLNEKEILAIILHEIGHNFYNSIFHVLSMTGVSIGKMIASGIMDAINLNKFYINFSDFVNNFASKHIRPLYLLITNAERILFQITSIFGKSLFSAVTNLPRIIKSFLTLEILTRYNVEKHADSFAVDHGYGKELASALNKMERMEKSLGNKIYNYAPIAWFYDLIDLQFEIIFGLLGPYPSTQNRIRSGLDRLKRDMKRTDLSPALRKELEQQIKEYEDFYNNYYLNIEQNQNRNRIFTWLYRKFVEAIFRGKLDIRELIYSLDRTKYN